MPLECEVWSIHNKQWPVVLYSSSKGETCTAVVHASTFRASGYTVSYTSQRKNYFYALFRLYVPVLVQERSSAIFPHLSLPPDSSSQTLKKQTNKQTKNNSQKSRNHVQTKHAVYEWCVGSFTSHWVVWTVRGRETRPRVWSPYLRRRGSLIIWGCNSKIIYG